MNISMDTKTSVCKVDTPSNVEDYVKSLAESYKTSPLQDDKEREKAFERIKAAMSGSYAKAFLNIPNGDG